MEDNVSKKPSVTLTVQLLRWLGVIALLISSAGLANAGYERAAMDLPPGFKVTTYITGSGFHGDDRGIPAVVAIDFHTDGTLYFARTANRLKEIYDRDDAPIYRIPPGRANITPGTEGKFLFGPPVADPDELGVNAQGIVFVSSRSATGYGSVYRLSSTGQRTLFAGGPPASGRPPLLKDPEDIAFDKTGNVYVIDVDLGVVVQLNPAGKVLNPRWISGIGRGRTLTFDPHGYLWIGSDGPHNTPHMDGSGQIFRYHLSSRKLELVHKGPLSSGMSLSPGGNIFAAQRRSARLFALTPEGKRAEFASFYDGAALRTLAFPPITPETKKLGIAGDLFIMVFPELDYPVREIIRVSGPFDSYVNEAVGAQ
jgi:hypothetical protein